MTNCLILFFAQTDTESRLVMRSIRFVAHFSAVAVAVVLLFCFILFSRLLLLLLLTLLHSPVFPLDVAALCVDRV